jgi:hypothetical protein
MSRVRVVRNVLSAGAATLLMTVTLNATVADASSVPAPEHVRATGTATIILVSWSRPPGAAVKSYVVTSKPAGQACVTVATRCRVKGLRPGVSYNFRVVARTSAGASVPSAPSNRVKIATPGAYFLKTLSVGSTQISKLETDYDNSKSASKARSFLTKLSGAFATLATSLSIEAWPSGARSDVSTFVSTFRTLGADTANELNATTNSGLAAAEYKLQSDTNKEILVESKVRTALSLGQLIISPIAATPVPGALGSTQTVHDFYDDAFSVTASQVIDPATAAPGSGLPDSGYRFVAVQVSVVNNSTAEVSDDANFAVAITGSDGQSYTADFGAVSQCTNFQDGFFDVLPNDSTSGCVVFELPTAVNVQSITFSLAQGYLDTAEWSN